MAIFQELDTQIYDESVQPVADAKMYIPTTDSGNRVNPVGDKFRNYRDFTDSDYVSYLSVSDAQGVVPTQSILTGRFWDANGSAYELQVDLY